MVVMCVRVAEELLVPMSTHHVCAYFKAASLRTCCRCQSQFLPLVSALLEPPITTSAINGLCCYHSGLYVCRYHPAELRLAVGTLHGLAAGGASAADGLGYYGNGKEGIHSLYVAFYLHTLIYIVIDNLLCFCRVACDVLGLLW